MQDVSISIVTVSYNSEATIKDTIEHVLNQTLPPSEYLIIDGKSSDRTVEIAKGYEEQFATKGIKYVIVSEKDDGIYNAMNKGIKLSTGDIVGIINSDDYYELDALQNVVDFYRETNFDIMYADLRIFGGEKEYIKKSKLGKRFTTRHWNHPSTFVSRKVYNQMQYAEESIYDDLDFMLRARSAGYKICVLNKTLADFRLGGISNKKSLRKCMDRIKLRNYIFKKNGCKHYRMGNFLIEFIKYILTKE